MSKPSILGIKKQLGMAISSMACPYEEQNTLSLLYNIDASFSKKDQEILIEKPG